MFYDRTKAFVAHIRASAKRTQIFNNIQEDLLWEWGAEVDHEGSDDFEGEAPSNKKGLPTKVLQLVTPMDTGWNPEFYMIER